MSVQLAELRALTAACQAGTGKSILHMHSVGHLFGAMWKMRGFRKTDGSPILHCDQVVELMSALLLPQQVAIVKCRAHKPGDDCVTKGNKAADEASKVASKQ
ncbi:Gag-Pol polyprotein [Merluccius polli]|uniref:Gag-Pol polyprotein n=1 Tax=Merluccius polli TaxID=89951 RepID=A0AA47NRM4_MERPO|nr:Gag-Pol polyprotein [Merluccius polli]